MINEQLIRRQLQSLKGHNEFVGEKVKLARRANGLELEEAADKIGISKREMLNIERDKLPDDDILIKISVLFLVQIPMFFKPRRYVVDDDDINMHESLDVTLARQYGGDV